METYFSSALSRHPFVPSVFVTEYSEATSKAEAECWEKGTLLSSAHGACARVCVCV